MQLKDFYGFDHVELIRGYEDLKEVYRFC